MVWPLDYAFVELTADQKTLRREALDRWGLVAHFSSLAPVAVLLFIRLVKFVSAVAREAAEGWYGVVDDRQGQGGGLGGGGRQLEDYDEVPHSPQLKSMRQTRAGGVAAVWRRVGWWFGADVRIPGSKAAWGTRWVWLASLLWLVWLVGLCVVETGNDYNHLTKRFGHVAMSQLPLHYLLSLKALPPVAVALRSSHEHLNKWHRALGRIIALLLSIHVALYLNYFVQAGIVADQLRKPVVVFGLVAIAAIAALYTTALTPLRTRSYRLFFATHIIVAAGLPVLVWLHVHHAKGVRLYATESLLALIVDIIYRRATAITVQARVEAVTGTDLIRITAPIPAHQIAQFAARPGSHVHVNIPPEARPRLNPLHPASIPYSLSYNPFTVAAVDERGASSMGRSRITLVARRQWGLVTRNLARYADAGVDLDMPLRIEGPYGFAGRRFSDLGPEHVDRVLLIAGGVGATFTAPLYRALSHSQPSPSRVSFVWTVRSAAEVSWAAGPGGRKLVDEPNVQLFITGAADGDTHDDSEAGGLLAGDAVELDTLRRDTKYRRPDWGGVVDAVFRKGGEERVAVLVCGPQGMAADVRKEVGRWVSKGRAVVWHDETFALG